MVDLRIAEGDTVTAATEGQRVPTISIYQNPDHVAGILQQIHNSPLVTHESHGATSDATNSSTDQVAVVGGGSVAVPFVGSGNASGTAGWSTDELRTSSSVLTRNYEYSQAYYLLRVREELRSRGQLTAVASVEDAQALSSGDFVEYQASFRANELNALLDIMTPELIAAITGYLVRSAGIAKFDAYVGDWDGLQTFSRKLYADAEVKESLAASVAKAVRTDFRSEKTREFYGEVGAGDATVTAITICDNPHFVVDDEDRILDGEFTVLGKVTSPVTMDVPILERNKVLDRLKPAAVDSLFAELRSSVAGKAQPFEARAGVGANSPVEDMLDIALSSRIRGPSFRVVPIAIFA